jgi:hypothetical protein
MAARILEELHDPGLSREGLKTSGESGSAAATPAPACGATGRAFRAKQALSRVVG